MMIIMSKHNNYKQLNLDDITFENCINFIRYPDYKFRQKVASLGGGLEILIDDPHFLVRKEVAKQGYGLEKLVYDLDEDVRVEVAKHGFGLEILKHDDSEYVRAEAKLQLSKRKRN